MYVAVRTTNATTATTTTITAKGIGTRPSKVHAVDDSIPLMLFLKEAEPFMQAHILAAYTRTCCVCVRLQEAKILDELGNPRNGLISMPHAQEDIQSLATMLTDSAYVPKSRTRKQAIDRWLATKLSNFEVTEFALGAEPFVTRYFS